VKNSIEALRIAKNWSMEELAERMGASVSSVNRLEKDQREMKVHELIKLIEIFAVAPDIIVPEFPRGQQASLVPSGLADEASSYGDGALKVSLPVNQDQWIANSNALSGIGLEEGDAFIVDMSSEAVEAAGTGDAMIVQLYLPGLKAVTLLRQFIEPNLFITNSKAENLPPLDKRRHDVHPKGVILSKVTPIRARRG